MCRRTSISAIGAVLLLVACGHQQAVRAPQSTSSSEAASHGLDTLRKLVNASNYRSMGFDSVDEVRSASLGDPLHIYMVRLDQLRDYQSNADPDKLLSDVDQELYPVVVVGSVRSAVLVEKQGEKWAAVSFGGANLVKALAQRRSDSAATSKTAAASYFEVHVAALNMYFLGFHQEDRLMLIPLVDDPQYKFSAGSPLPASDVFAALVPAAKAVPTDRPL